ncbi:MFS general substrate transporter [Mollisia scopiformis]|uniref:MFS general substrate transporter n=1 Tax=Mollisia scopiformis TaxID=149040 RepID=A0A194WTH2_MOLSC|nr:MFS general substrate transporter [Mollisia scopiformis]KUJ11263.1 MFS general substrate transporter [Mollisia scopiformis]
MQKSGEEPTAMTIENAGSPEAHHDRKTQLQSVDLIEDEYPVKLSWRSWLVVFIICFVNMSQIFVVTAAGSVIAFIIRDLGDASISGWIIQGPLLMQAVLSPIVGRLSDVIDRRYLVSIPPLIAFAGAVISARAESMSVLIGGGILIGFTLSTVAIIEAVPAEVLPLKYRALASGLGFVGGATGGLLGVLGAGGVTNTDAGGWRSIFWIQAAFHLTSSVSLLIFYHPKRHPDYPDMTLKEIVWACDPIGSALFIEGSLLLLLAFDWSSAYPWGNVHVAIPIAIGGASLLLFCFYEWKGRSDGIVAHSLFKGSPNFMLSVFAFAVEGWIFYSAVNSITPQIVLNLGFEDTSWQISIRQLSYNLVSLFACLPITWYATKYKDLKNPTIVCFVLFLIVCICYATITPAMNHAQIGYNVIAGIGQAGPLILIVALVQFTAPHQYLSCATGLAFSARAIGGAFGSAVLDAIINGKLNSKYEPSILSAATGAGLSASAVPALLAALAAGDSTAIAAVPGINESIIAAVVNASHSAYASAYRLAWVSIIPFVVLAIVAIFFLKGVKEQMTEKVEATVEHVPDKLGMEK